jgi:sugar-specific transcriptional regulator TrmB
LYVHLCMAGPAKVSDLAEALKLHRNDVYRTAERLMQRGLIETTVERPARYVAIDPQKVFDSEITTRLKAIDSLKRSREEISSLLLQLHMTAPQPSRGTYKVVQGRPEIHAMRTRLVSEAKTSIEWATSFAPSVPMADLSGSLDAMMARVQEGVQFRALARATPHSLPKMQPFLKYDNAQVRRFEVESVVRFLLVDDAQLLMYVVNDPSESIYAKEEVALHTTAPGFVHAQKVFFDQSWASAPAWE